MAHARFRAAVLAAMALALSACAAQSGAATRGGSFDGVTPGVSLDPAHNAAAASLKIHDYVTFGYDLARTGYNPVETTLRTSNVRNLHAVWQRDLGGAIDAQPVIASGIVAGGTRRDLLYVGTERGAFYALDARTGATVWQKKFTVVRSSCKDLPGGAFGITGSAAIDRAHGRVYVPGSLDAVAAFDLATGKPVSGWPVTIATDVRQDHIYSALTLNPANGKIYAATASFCDNSPWRGRVAAIDTASASVVRTFYPGGKVGGAGVWGMGGVSIDVATNDVFAVTGNTSPGPEKAKYGEHIVRLDARLRVRAANAPALTGGDMDFGATPMLLRVPGCPVQAVAKNKSGVLVTWSIDAIRAGATQVLTMANDTDQGEFIGVTAYSPVANLVYVGVPDGIVGFDSGIVALQPRSDCTLALAWQHAIGGFQNQNDNAPPTVANGVVYFAAGVLPRVYAFEASSGRMLWNSGNTIAGPVFTPPTVDGYLYVPSWDHHLYAFGF